MLQDKDEIRAWALLVSCAGLTRERVMEALKEVGSAARLVRCRDSELQRFGFGDATRERLRAPDREQIEADLSWLGARPDRHLIPADSGLYPPLLAGIDGAPVALYVEGSPQALADPQLAMVGSRKPTSAGRDTAYEFASHLARCGLTITSGMAEGIDAASHEGALDAGGRTIAVCGTGLAHVFPARHAKLAERIARQGALVSEFAPHVGPRREHFPRRNRIISGLSLGTLVVEAAKQSGSLITARCAAEQGREVFAIPGSIHNPMARGCHKLLREGAKLVETAEDILVELRLPPPALNGPADSPPGPEPEAGLDKDYEILLDALAFEPVDLGTLARRSGLKPEAVASMLLILELQGAVELRPGGRYCRTNKK